MASLRRASIFVGSSAVLYAMNHRGTETQSEEKPAAAEMAEHDALAELRGGKTGEVPHYSDGWDTVNYINSPWLSPCLCVPVVNGNVHRRRVLALRWGRCSKWLYSATTPSISRRVPSGADEVERIERLLSWRDACSETSRVNREAAARPVLVDFELCSSSFDLQAKRKRRPPDTST